MWTCLPSRQSPSTLILNELVSNAVKHAAGSIEVSFRVAGKRAQLCVCDNGAGFPDGFDPGAEAHTGLELVLGMCQTDLKGDISFENREECGGRVRLLFPLPESGGSERAVAPAEERAVS